MNNEIIFYIPQEYPQEIPSISFRDTFLTKIGQDSFYTKFRQKAEVLKGNAMLFELIIWCKKELELTLINDNNRIDQTTKERATLSPTTSFRRSVLLLDHMRNEINYIKSIRELVDNLNLAGILLFCNKTILLILEGAEENLKASLNF